MRTVSLRAYAIRLYDRGKKDKPKYRNAKIRSVLIDLLDGIKNVPVGGDQGRAYALDGSYEAANGPDGYVRGRLLSGAGGYASQIVEKKGKLAFSRRPEHLEVIPYYFYVSLPSGDRCPIVCIQQFSGSGTYPFFASTFMDACRAKLEKEELTARLQPIYVSDLYIKEFYEHGTVKEITAITHTQASDAADGSHAARIRSELAVSPVKRRGTLGPLKDIMKGGHGMARDRNVVFANVKSLFELEVDAADLEQLVVLAELNGVRRRISIGEDFGTTFDITDEVQLDADGHPDKVAMGDYVNEFVSVSIRKYVGVT